jgi:hypothetical protein
MRRALLVALSLLLVGLVAAPAQAWHVVEVRGRKLDTFSHLGNPDLGQAACSVQARWSTPVASMAWPTASRPGRPAWRPAA